METAALITAAALLLYFHFENRKLKRQLDTTIEAAHLFATLEMRVFAFRSGENKVQEIFRRNVPEILTEQTHPDYPGAMRPLGITGRNGVHYYVVLAEQHEEFEVYKNE